MAHFSTVELEALQLTFSGMSDIQAYKHTHPKAKEATCQKTAYAFFKRIRAKLSKSEELQMRNLSHSRVFTEIEKRLNATSPYFFKGDFIQDYDDNTTRMKATALLAKINGLLDPVSNEQTQETEDTEIRIIIDNEHTE